MSEEIRKKFEEIKYQVEIIRPMTEAELNIAKTFWREAYKAGAESVEGETPEETYKALYKRQLEMNREFLKEIQQLKADKAELVEGVSKILDKLEKADEVANKNGFMTKSDMLDLLTEVFDDLNQLPITKHKEQS